MAEDISERIAYGLNDLPNAPPLGDLTRLYSPAELAAMKMRRAGSRRRDADPTDGISPTAAASVAGALVPGSAIADFLGYYPNFEGGYEPSFVENMRRGNYGTAGLQTLGLAGDALYVMPALGATIGTAARFPRAAQRIGKFAKYAEEYPPVGAARLVDKFTGKEIQFASQAEAETLVSQGKARWRKNIPPETKEFAKARRAIQRDMDEHGYTPYFPPAERADVDPKNYPTSLNMSVDAMPKRPETVQKYRDAYQTEDAINRLRAAYKEGEQIPNAEGIFFMKQLEDKYVNVLGPAVGKERFKTEFADAMAATTAGNNPTANYLMSHYVGYMNKRGLEMPKAGHQMPYPIGGAFAGRNAAQAQKLFDNPRAGFGAKNPKRHDFSYSIAGHTDKPPVDSVMSGAIVPGMRAPRYYGPASELLRMVADQLGVDARHFQDLARAGLQKMKHDAKRAVGATDGLSRFKPDGPLIDVVNESIERTHRLTGMPRDEIVERGLVLKEIPMYGIGGAMAAPMAAYGLGNLSSDTNSPTRDGSL